MTTTADRSAKFISGLSSPFLIGMLGLVLLITLRPETTGKALYWLFLYVGLTLVIPLLYIGFQVLRGHLTDIHVMVREQRRGPFIVGLTSVVVLFGTLFLLQAPTILLVMTVATLLNGTTLLIGNRFTKISVHAAALASTTTALGILISPWFFLGYLGLPPIMWARLKRGRHTSSQFLLGTIEGALVTFAAYKIFGF